VDFRAGSASNEPAGGNLFMSLSISSVVRWDPNQIAATVDREIVILSVERGSYYGLDDIGSEIWEKLANPTSIGAICDVLAEKYQGDRATIERDVLSLLEQMAAEGLISIES
jgi:Coenzyme PQQ synthesis protein D (PqqD)